MYGQPMMQPAYGQPMYGQPMMQQQPMMMQPTYMQPPPQQGPTIIKIDDNKNEGTPCKFCGTNTSQIVKKKMGCVAVVWCICLFGVALCFLPCCMDGCKDSDLVCIKCQQVKNTIPANCC
jgi:hypothetical protein